MPLRGPGAVLAVLLLATGLPARQPATQPTAGLAEVDPFIGTGGHGHTYPGATVPFGAVQLSPDTRLDPYDWDGAAGYHQGDPVIYGFSHLHLSGTGIPDGCDILFAPHTGPARLGNGRDGTPGYGSAYDHADETAAPGYYAVRLKDYDILAELTASAHCGFHRYQFSAGRTARITVDLQHRDPVLAANVRVNGDRELEGFRQSRSWAQDQRVFFVARFSRPFRSWGLEAQGQYRTGQRQAGGSDLKAHLVFDDQGGPLLVRVGLSAVDLDGARRNLEAELPDWDFDAARARAEALWSDYLGRITVQGGDPDLRRIFQTALYHTALAPTLFQDVDGRYRGRDGAVHPAEEGSNYTCFSLWDTFRAEHPLLVLIQRKRTRDFLRTFLRQYRQGGRLPVWELWGNETDCMIGYHAVSVLADALVKGIDAVDPAEALAAMEHSAREDRGGLGAYRALGYVPADAADRSVSRTLEYAYDDWCIAQVAGKLGLADDCREFGDRSRNYRNLYDPATGFFRARWSGGAWWAPFDPFQVNDNYTESNAWQYSCCVPQDLDGLMHLHGGPEGLVSHLDALFTAPSATTGRQQRDLTGMIGQCAQGNEPSHHLAYLYACAGQPWKTQERVRQLQLEMYTDQPDGLVGNDDCGQMSAWYVLSALGIYAVTPGSTVYVLGAPLFPQAVLHLENGRSFVIRADGAAKDAPYIQSASLNGKPYDRAWIDTADILAGGELDLVMGTRPNPRWGRGDRPGNSANPE